MKRLIGWLLAFCALAAQASDVSKAPSYGAHGMAVFGGSGGVLASHLAMFHAPHDYQVLLQIQLADPALEGALRAQLQAEPKLWSIDPEKFPLTDLWQAKQPRKQFRADLYQGHFERGGKLVHKQVLIEVRLSDFGWPGCKSAYAVQGSNRIMRPILGQLCDQYMKSPD